MDRATRVSCEPEERDYILAALHYVFPAIPVGAADVVFAYSGIRPLPTSDHEFTGRISRGHSVHRHDGIVPVFSMVGGKWTTFRAFAEDTADAVMTELGYARQRSTADLPIGGGAAFEGSEKLVDMLMSRHGVTRSRAVHLADVYGTRADAVLRFCHSHRDQDGQLAGTQITGAEIAFLARNEYVHNLSDMMLRRTPLAISGEVSRVLIEQVATVLGAELGWDGARLERETSAFVSELSEYYGVSADTLMQRSNRRSDPCA